MRIFPKLMLISMFCLALTPTRATSANDADAASGTVFIEPGFIAEVEGAREEGAPAFKREFFDVYDLIRTEDEETFMKKLKEIPEAWSWIDEEGVRKSRLEHLQKRDAIKKKYSVCKTPGARESLPAVLKELGDVKDVLQYGLCKRLESGADGCDVLKESFPERRQQCVSYESKYWFDTMPFLLRKEMTDEDLHNYSANYCKDSSGFFEGLTDPEYCTAVMKWMLTPVRFVLRDKDRKTCDAFPDDAAGDYCNAVFDRDMDFCKKNNKDFPLICMEKIYKGTMAVALSDAGVLSPEEKMSAVGVFVNYYLDNSYCDRFYEERIESACDDVMVNAIKGIRVTYP